MKDKRNVQQHFVPASYLAGFTAGGTRESYLYVYERNSRRIFRTLPSKVAKRRNYYSIPTLDGGMDDQVDRRLTALEGQAIPVLRKLLLRDYRLTTFERALLSYLVAYQELRTPWARSNFHTVEVATREHLFRSAARTPGYFEKILDHLQATGESDGTVSADQIREAFEKKKIKLVANPHAGIESMVETSEMLGNICAQMSWDILRSKDRRFVTSDAPVVRRTSLSHAGFYTGGIMNAEIWFPLSGSACLLMRHDTSKLNALCKVSEKGNAAEVEMLRAKLPSINEKELSSKDVDLVNRQTILNADRFIFSSFECVEIVQLLKGESQNSRFVVS